MTNLKGLGLTGKEILRCAQDDKAEAAWFDWQNAFFEMYCPQGSPFSIVRFLGTDRRMRRGGRGVDGRRGPLGRPASCFPFALHSSTMGDPRVPTLLRSTPAPTRTTPPAKELHEKPTPASPTRTRFLCFPPFIPGCRLEGSR